NETDFLSSVYGGEGEALSLTTTTGFFNSDFGGTTGGDINPALLAFFPDLAADSWLSIGLEANPVDDETAVSAVESSGQPFLACFAAGDPLSGTDVLIDDETGGAWYILNGASNGLPDENMRVIIFQITTAGELCGLVNVQLFEEGDGFSGDTRLTFDFCGPGVFNPVSDEPTGCTDQTACNFDADATEDDGSCTYAEAAYDCDGNCLNDTDGDGICDEFETPGCTDAFACNFNENATDDDASCEYESCIGCTDVDACNFDADAIYNDGSCEYMSCAVQGCTNMNACNYNPEATFDDGSCEYSSCIGCTDADACNFDMDATTDNGSCEFPSEGYDCDGNCVLDTDGDGICDANEIPGCMDSEAGNYDPAATDEDGSCVYPAGALDLVGVIDFTVPGGGSAGKAIHLVALEDIDDLSVYGIGVANNGGGSDGQEYTLCAGPASAGDDILIVRDAAAMSAYFANCFGEFELVCDEDTDDISQNGDDAIELFEMGVVIETFGEIDVDGSGQAWEYTDSWAFQNDEGDWTYGGVNCTDGTANIYESSCLYPICSPLVLGCTDETACNYDAEADTDNGSCTFAAEALDCDGNCVMDSDGDGICDEFEVAGCSDMMACNYDELATDNDGSCDYFSADFFDWSENMFIGFPADSSACPMGTELYNDAFYTLLENGMGYSWDVNEADLNELIDVLGTELGTLFYNELDQANLVFCGDMLNVYNSPAFGSYSVMWNGTSFDIPSLGIYVVPESTASFGCSDVEACNFDACTIGDLTLCEYAEEAYDCDGNCLNDADADGVCDEFEVAGCTDMMACNYDEAATDDDGSCGYAEEGYDCDGNCLNDADGDGVCDEFEVAGCTDVAACNYNEDATDDDGSCEFAEEAYDCDGNCLNDADGDGICDEFEVEGCTDPEAENYDETATDDDGSCFYCDIAINVDEVTGDVNDTNSGSIEITVAGGSESYTYSWSGPDAFASSDEDLNGLAGGTYTLVITDTNDCTASIEVVVDDLIDGVREMNGSWEVTAYPNPTADLLWLETSDLMGVAQIRMYDGAGKLVLDQQFTANNGLIQLNVNGLSSGSYHLVVRSNDQVAVERIQIR
ncbi:MAG: T9SS type A sorting domain-containing protein, partial [Flavobacteriales bacterium]|nr:T9SS type A sorting domain-containing protein [Flavobacteriales bacterium]